VTRVRELGHGPWPRVTLTAARRLAAEAKAAADRGIDPVAAKRTAKAAAAAAGTLRDAMEGYLAAHGPAWRGKTEKLIRARLEQHAKGLLQRPVGEIGLEDVRAVLAPIWTTKPETAQRVRAHMEAALEWSIAAGWRSGPNPALWKGGLRPLLARPGAIRRVRHHPALDWRRVPAFLAVLRQQDGNASRCLELATLTAVRSGEARAARWEHIDLDAALWTIPVTKTGKAHRVPLSATTLRLLRSMLPADGKKPQAGLVFTNGKGATYSDMALLSCVKRLDVAATGAGEPGWRDEHGERVTPHGFRSSFRDWCGDTGQPRELAEMALAHAVGGEVERAYARSDLLERRRALMSAWGELCEGRAGASVAPLRVVA